MDKKVPEIRFKEFEGEWTETPLREIFSKQRIKNTYKLF